MTRELEAALKWARTELQNPRRTASYVSIPRDWLRELVAAVRRAKMCPHGEWPAECLTCLDDHAEEAAALRAQAEGGTVPREPTHDMMYRGGVVRLANGDAGNIWRAMYDAAPRASEGKEPDAWIAACRDADAAQADQNPASGNSIRALSSEHTAGAPAAPDAELIAEIDDAMREQVSTTVRCLLRERLRTRLAQPADDPLPLSEWQRLQIEIATAQAELRTARAALESKDKALREIASIRPFGMISDAQIIASAALGDTQEPT